MIHAYLGTHFEIHSNLTLTHNDKHDFMFKRICKFLQLSSTLHSFIMNLVVCVSIIMVALPMALSGCSRILQNHKTHVGCGKLLALKNLSKIKKITLQLKFQH